MTGKMFVFVWFSVRLLDFLKRMQCWRSYEVGATQQSSLLMSLV